MSLKKAIDRLRRRLGINRRSPDLDEELEFHLQKEIEQNLAAGMSQVEARRRALISFGGVQQTRESVRQVYWVHFWEVLLQDVRYGWRMLRKSPVFTVVSVLILALAIGMNSAIFSMIDAVLFRALPVKDPQSLLLLRWNARHEAKSLDMESYGDCPDLDAKANPTGCIFSLPFFRAAQSQTDAFSSLAAFAGAPQIALSGNGPATILNQGELVSGSFFQTLGVGAAIGRTLAPGDDTPSATPVMMLGYAYWQSAFAGDPGVVGRTVRLNGKPFTIVGISERGFEALTPARRFDVWLPLSARPQLKPDWKQRDDQENSWWLVVVGRTRTGVAAEQAQAAISLFYRNQMLGGAKPIFQPADTPAISMVPAQEGLEGSRSQILQPLYVMLLAVGLILLIACANVAGLLLARATARQKEIAVRLTLGARRGRLLLQLLMESSLLSFMGGAAGLLLGHWGARLIVTLANTEGGPQLAPQLDGRVLIFTTAVSILTSIIFGMLPAFRSLRLDLTPALKMGNGGSPADNSRHRWYSLGNSLVVAQVALAMVALVAAGLLVHSLSSLKSVDLGFEPHNLLLFGIDPTLAGYKDSQVDLLYPDLQAQFAALPGIASVSYSWRPLLAGAHWRTGFHPRGTPEHETANTDYLPVGPGFFKTMGIAMKAGRDFAAADFAISAVSVAARKADKPVQETVPVPVIVNEAFVRRYLSRGDPLGQHVESEAPDNTSEPRRPGWQVVGVVRDAKYNSVRREISPTVYAPASGGQVFFELRTQGDPNLLTAPIRDIVNRKDSTLALFRISTQLERVDSGLVVERMLANLSSLFGLLALLLACMGLYGLLSYEVARRTREIGIRMAVGARQHNVIRIVISQALALALAGAAVGIASSFAIGRLLRSILYGVHPGDPISLAGVAILLLLVTLVSCYLPARRATRIDPLIALRYE
jgi:predicted permease